MYTQIFKEKSLCLRARAFGYEKKRRGLEFRRGSRIPRSRDRAKIKEESRDEVSKKGFNIY